MEYIKIATTDEVGKNQKKKITLKDMTILLVNVEGTYYALDNKCPHMGGSLFDGILTGNGITCPRHKTTFDVTTGKVVVPGKMAFIKVNPGDARTFPVRVVGSDILVGIE